ncbi:MAG: restriction endonuclease [Planctomycetota bacterium]|nr:MAG: restriction endonuclease [Planctomycetota bacterium]
MTSKQYEELCRFFVAEQLKLPLSCVRSLHVANPERPPELWHTNLGPYRHQIDLYWETPGQTTSYLNIANAKWHQEGDKVGLKDVLLLQQVRSKIAAHKALLITNTDYGRGARRAAADEGLALLIVRPEFAAAVLTAVPEVPTQERFQQLAVGRSPIYSWQVVQKGLAGGGSVTEVLGLVAAPQQAQPAVPAPAYAPRPLAAPAPAAPPAPSRGSPAPGPSAAPGYAIRHGPGPGFRMK